uniref:Uncharacterized protein n=1 Tax=Triticum urartu TaxID=4572 RepID=A0A8R7UVZ4_TRIUA
MDRCITPILSQYRNQRHVEFATHHEWYSAAGVAHWSEAQVPGKSIRYTCIQFCCDVQTVKLAW